MQRLASGLLVAGLAACSGDDGGAPGDAAGLDAEELHDAGLGGDSSTISPLFRMDYAASAAPLGGWEGMRADNADHTLTHVPSGGPAGDGAYRLVLDHTGPNSGDNYWGHGQMFTGAPFTYGGRVFLRWRFRWLAGTDCRAYEQFGTGLVSGVARNKVIIANDGSSSTTSRFILTTVCERDPLGYRWNLGKGGGVDPANTPTYPVTDAWSDVQVELQYGSSQGAPDGAYRIWVDSNTRSTPTAERTGIVLDADLTPGYIQFGAYFNNGVYTDGHIGWEHAAFEIDDEFDPAWH